MLKDRPTQIEASPWPVVGPQQEPSTPQKRSIRGESSPCFAFVDVRCGYVAASANLGFPPKWIAGWLR